MAQDDFERQNNPSEDEIITEGEPRRRVGFYFDEEPVSLASDSVEPLPEGEKLQEPPAEGYLSEPNAPERERVVRLVKSGMLRESPLVCVAHISRKKKGEETLSE